MGKTLLSMTRAEMFALAWRVCMPRNEQHRLQVHRGPSDPPSWPRWDHFLPGLGAALRSFDLYVSSLVQMSSSPLLTGCLAFSTDLASISKTFPPAEAGYGGNKLALGEIPAAPGHQTKERSITAGTGAGRGLRTEPWHVGLCPDPTPKLQRDFRQTTSFPHASVSSEGN